MLLTTKHAKSMAVAPPFWEQLGASVLEYVVDTDQLGTFTGEIEREGSDLDCARRKCEWAFHQLGDKVDFALASEGSFGPHPFLPYLPVDHEVLYFIDRRRNFHLHLSYWSEETNYRMASVDSWEALQSFASASLFPSHALILRAHDRHTKGLIFKGIQSVVALEEAFEMLIRCSGQGKIWVETDMRASCNPTRMKVIGELATLLARRLGCLCPACHTPGWGKVRAEKGLPCRGCGHETELIKTKIYGCVNCTYTQASGRSDGLERADPGQCAVCNP